MIILVLNKAYKVDKEQSITGFDFIFKDLVRCNG